MFVTHVAASSNQLPKPMAWTASVSEAFGLRKLSQGTDFGLSFLLGPQAGSQAVNSGARWPHLSWSFVSWKCWRAKITAGLEFTGRARRLLRYMSFSQYSDTCWGEWKGRHYPPTLHTPL